MLRSHRPFGMGLDRALVDHRPQHVIGNQLEIIDLMRGAESVKKMQKRNPRSQRGRVRDTGQVVGFLNARRGKQREAGLTHRHDIRVIAKNREGMGRQRAGRHVHAEWHQLPGQLIHDGDHQQEPLRSGERRRQRAALQHSVDGSSHAGFRLHLDNFRNVSPQIPAALARPFVRKLAHRCGGRDGINRNCFAKPVSDIRRRFVSIHTLPRRAVLSLHGIISYTNTRPCKAENELLRTLALSHWQAVVCADLIPGNV